MVEQILQSASSEKVISFLKPPMRSFQILSFSMRINGWHCSQGDFWVWRLLRLGFTPIELNLLEVTSTNESRIFEQKDD